MTGSRHILTTLSLPSRYEALVESLGHEVLNVLVRPEQQTLNDLEDAAIAIHSTGEGLFAPLYALPGTGKTTLAENITSFLPQNYCKTLRYEGELEASALDGAVSRFKRDNIAADDTRIIPLNVDHRENRPPSPSELSEIKRFLRAQSGRRVLMVWPGTLKETSESMAEDYRQISGTLPISLPLKIQGPPRPEWSSLAAETLRLANQVDSLEELIDIRSHPPEPHHTLGDYLRSISTEFNTTKARIQRAMRKEVQLTICFVSTTSGHGILSSLTSSRRYGMLDPTALLQASGGSRTGRWWNARRGLLVQTIVTLDAHALTISPPLTLAVLSCYGDDAAKQALTNIGVPRKTPSTVLSRLESSDLGKRLMGEERSVGETRGNPGDPSRASFTAFVDTSGGFSSGRDKPHNHAFAKAFDHWKANRDTPYDQVIAESNIEAIPHLIPDVSLQSRTRDHCIEFTYRKGDFAVSANRSTIANYCLEKLQNYARELGWTSDSE